MRMRSTAATLPYECRHSFPMCPETTFRTEASSGRSCPHRDGEPSTPSAEQAGNPVTEMLPGGRIHRRRVILCGFRLSSHMVTDLLEQRLFRLEQTLFPSLAIALSCEPVGEDELIDEHARRAMDGLTDAVADHFGEPTLARLWAAEQLRRATVRYIDELIAEARRGRWEAHTASHTWEEIGAVLGISAQGARQRLLRRRDPVPLSSVRPVAGAAPNPPH